MLTALILFADVAKIEGNSSPEAFDFSRSYMVWVATWKGRCTYFMTDAGEDAAQLTETLRSHYDKALGMEILTDGETPRRCIVKARKAVANAGFRHFRVRLGTDRDRSPGIP